MYKQRKSPSTRLSEWMASFAPAARVDILLAIGRGEACVCHLERALRMRQALLSQHLMALRRTGLLLSRKDGRFVYYRLADARVLDLLRDSFGLAGEAAPIALDASYAPEGCTCPQCSGTADAGAAPREEDRRHPATARSRRDPLAGVVS